MTAQPAPLNDPFHLASVPDRGGPQLAGRTVLGDLLHREMDRRGITAIDKLADALGVGYYTAWRWLRTPSRPRADKLPLIAEFLHMPITEVRTAAGRPAGELERFVPPPDLDQLTYGERALLVQIGRTMRAARETRVTQP